MKAWENQESLGKTEKVAKHRKSVEEKHEILAKKWKKLQNLRNFSFTKDLVKPKKLQNQGKSGEIP